MATTRMMGATMEFNVQVHHENGSYWAEVVELPGVFASGATLDELVEALGEAIRLYRDDPEGKIVHLEPTGGPEERLTESTVSAQGLRIAVPA